MGRSMVRGKKSPVSAKVQPVELSPPPSGSFMVQSRARRTPKPNPKYVNDQVVLNKAKVSSSQFDSSEEADDDNEESENEQEINSEIEKLVEQRNKAAALAAATKRKMLITRASASSSPVVSKPATPANTAAATPGGMQIRSSAKKIYESKDLTIPIRKIQMNKVAELSKVTISSPVTPKGVTLRQRPQQTSTPVARPVATTAPANSAATPIQKKPIPKPVEPPAKAESPKVVEPPPKRILRKRKNDDEDFEVSISSEDEEDEEEDDDDMDIEQTTRRRGRQPSIKQRKVEVKSAAPVVESKLLQLMRAEDDKAKPSKSISPKLQLNPPTKTNDIETEVPTFTIVNINDIIKKGPEPPKKSKLPELKKSPVAVPFKITPKPQITQKNTPANQSLQAALRQVQIAKKIKEAQLKAKKMAEQAGQQFLEEAKSSSSSTMDDISEITHNPRTVVYSSMDDFETKIKANAVSKVAPNDTPKQIKLPAITSTSTPINNNIRRGIASSISVGSNGKFKDAVPKPAPRILNSMLGKNKSFQSPLLNEHDLAIDTKRSSETKENVKSYTNTTRQNNTALQTNKTRLEALMNSNPKVVFENQGGTRVKKITCFETWYVINIPNAELPIPKPQVMVTLVSLGNKIKELELPSSDWSYRINLAKITRMNTSAEKYEGEIHDANVKSDEKSNYEPASVIFRRTNINRSVNMQYDRAVTFKNRSYFLNIDGKNVRLVGAPQSIHSLNEIETLIQIINDVSLVNPYIEPIAFSL